MKRLVHLAVIATNLAIAAWHLLGTIWVLGGVNREVLTGAAYEWPMHIRIVSAATGLLAILFIVASLRMHRARYWGRLVIVVVAILAVLHIYEALQLMSLYGGYPRVLSGAVLLPLWVVALVLYMRRLRPNNSFKPTPLRGAA